MKKKMCQLIFLKIYVPTATEKWRKNPVFIYQECQARYSNSYLKLHNTHLLHLFVDMYTWKFPFKKKLILQG